MERTWRLEFDKNDGNCDRFLPPESIIEIRSKINDFPSTNPKILKRFFGKSEKLATRDKKENIEFEGDNNEELIIEGFLITVSRLIISTINDLSSELVSVNEALDHERDRRESCVFQIDRLQAMLRVSNGNGQEYRSRVEELKHFVRRMNEETRLLKSRSHEIMNRDGCFILSENNLNGLKSLMKELRAKLRNDQAALASGGNRWCSVYIEKISELETCVENLVSQVKETGSTFNLETATFESSDNFEFLREMSEIKELAKHVACELQSLAVLPITNGSRIGSEGSISYFRKIGSLENLVTNSMNIIDELNIESRVGQIEGSQTMKSKDYRCNENFTTLQILGKKLILGVKQLERLVAAGDGAYSFEKIRRLEATLDRLKKKLSKSEEDKISLGLQLTGAKIAYDEKFEELEIIRKKHEKMLNKMKIRGKLFDDEEHLVRIIRELEQSKLNATVLGNEVNRLKSELENSRSEKGQLAGEIEKIQSDLVAKTEEIAKIVKDKKNKERISTKETMETKSKLSAAEKAMQSLKKEIADLQSEKLARENETTIELKNLKSQLKSTRENLELRNRKISDLETNCNEIKIEKDKIEQELSCSKKQNEAAVVRLNLEKTTHSKILKDFEKLRADYQSLSVDREQERKTVDISEREKSLLKTKIDNYHREKVSMEKEAACLRLKLEKLKQSLDEEQTKNREYDKELLKSSKKQKDQEIRLNSLIKENDSLKDDLDKVRSDKLNIIGTLNEMKYNYETTQNLLNSKITETKKLKEKLELNLIDLETLRKSEHSAKSEVEKFLETSTRLQETIDVANSEREILEKRLKNAQNDCEALENKLRILNTEKEALVRDSSRSSQRIDELTEKVTVLCNKIEENARERSQFIGDHENTVEGLKKKLDELETERANLAKEVTRGVSDENSALERDYEKIAFENENVRSRGKKSEISRLAKENEALKLQLSKLTIFISEADREVAKNEMERMCSELVRIRAENSSLKKLRNRKRIVDEKSSKDSRELEDEIIAWKSANESLKNDLEIAENRININEMKLKEIETERNMLKGSIEGLKERYKLSIKETEEARLRNKNLDQEIEELKKYCETLSLEDSALKQEMHNLHQDSIRLNDENSQIQRSLIETQGELIALKDELAKLRSENISLCVQLESKIASASCVEEENSSLRLELEEIRLERISVIEEMKELRGEQEKLVTLKLTLEGKLIDAHKEIAKYVLATEKLNELEKKLKNVLKSYVITKKMLKSANEEIDHLRHFANVSFRNSPYGEKIEAI